MPSSDVITFDIDSVDPSTLRTLTIQEEMFVRFYCASLDTELAAKQAGYTMSGTQVSASVLSRPEIRYHITKRLQSVFQSLNLEAQLVIQELAVIGFSDIRDCFDNEGNFIDIKHLPDRVARAIQSVKIKRRIKKVKNPDLFNGENSNLDEIEEEIEVKFWNKVQALQLLKNHFNPQLSGDNNKESSMLIDPNSLPSDVKEELYFHIAKKLKSGDK